MSDLFREKAQDWDVNDLVKELSSAIGGSLLQQLSFHEKMDVMDFGAGTGLISSYVAPLVHNVVAVDISQAMLDKLAEKPELKGKVETICQDITEKPIHTQFDLIMSAMAMHHVEDTQKLVHTFSEHLKPGAMVALADLDKEDGSFHPEDIEGVFHFGFERDAFQTILENNGFENIRFVTAHTIKKEEKEYPVFLVTATKG